MLNVHRFFISLGIIFIVFLLYTVDFRSDNIDKRFNKWLSGISTELKDFGIQQNIIDNFSAIAQINQYTLQQNKNNAQVNMPINQKINKLTREEVVLYSQLLYQDNKDIIEQKSKQYKIPSDIVVASITIGSLSVDAQKHNLLNTIATLAFLNQDDKRYLLELKYALKLVQDDIISFTYRGNSDGTIGILGIYPSIYSNYAPNIYQGKQIDLDNSIEDILDTAYNIYAKRNWDTEERWGARVILNNNIDFQTLQGTERARYNDDWSALGLIQYNQQDIPKTKFRSSLIVLNDNIDGVLLYSNFDIIFNLEEDLAKAIATGIISDSINEYIQIMNYAQQNVKPNPKPKISKDRKQKIDYKPIRRSYRELQIIK